MSKSKLVMAHAMRKAAKKKLASGGSVKSGSKDMNYAKGGEARNSDAGAAASDHKEPGHRKLKSGHTVKIQGPKTAHVYSPEGKYIDTMHPSDVDRKYAEGGSVSAKSEKRPMPDNRYNDSKEASRNSGDKPAKNDSWADNITVKQAQKPSVTKLSQPKIVGSDAFSVRNMNMRDDENDLGDSIHPETDRRQPIKRDDEYDAKKMGKGPDMASQHNNKKAPYNKEIEDQYAQDMAAAEMKKVQSYAAGGKVEAKEADGAKTSTGGAKTGGAKTSTTGNKTKTGGSNPGGASTGGAGTVTITTRDLGSKGINVSNVGGKTAAKNHGGMDPGDEDDDGKALMAQGGRMEPRDNHEELIERDDEAHLQSEEAPSEDEGSEEAHSLNEDDEMGHNSGRIDMEEPHNQYEDKAYGYAQGGNVDMHKEMDDQPSDEEMMEHAASIAAGIMAKRAHKRFMAAGGILSKDSIDSDDSSQVDLSRNADEDANEEDQLSFNALRKENYSESAGLKKLNQPSDSNETNDPREDESENKRDKSIVSKIMKKRKSSPITK